MNIVTIPLDRWIGHDPVYKFNKRSLPIRYIIMHSTGGKDSRNWLSKWNKGQPKSAQNQVSIHYLVQRNGIVYRIIDDAQRAWHAGIGKMLGGETDCNSCSIGIELEHLNEPNYTEPQLNNAAELVAQLIQQYDISPAEVVSHASIALPKGRKIDPVNFDWGDFWTRILSYMPKSVTQYSAQSTIMAEPAIDSDKFIDYLVSKHKFTQYTEADVRLILGYYVKYCKALGIDYVLAITQMIYETGWLESWWSARPRRNPAGIGVSGKTVKKDPNDTTWWAQDGAVWHKGRSYKSWDLAVQEHLARLLLYAKTDAELTPAQLAFTAILPDKAKLAKIRGKGAQWGGLNGTWAVPGHGYAEKLALIANGFVKASQ